MKLTTLLFLHSIPISNAFTFTTTTRYPRTSQAPFRIKPNYMTTEDDAYNYFDDDVPSKSQLESLTVEKLRQQLRLRNQKVSGKKSDLIQRLLNSYNVDVNMDMNNSDNDEETESGSEDWAVQQAKQRMQKSKAQQFAESQGKELIDVSEYLESEDVNKETKTLQTEEQEDEDEEQTSNSNSEKSPETWGSEAKIVDDYEGRSVVVDGLSRTVVQFKGSLQQQVNAYVVASRDSLKTFLAGGDRGNNATDLEDAVKNIQIARERASKVPMTLQDSPGEDVDDEPGYYKHILDRDYGDWGKYSMTGAQLSAQEVKGLLLLSDVYGPFSDDMQALADKIAFECQPVVVFAPDLFRGDAWLEDTSNPGFNAAGNTYEEWRANHPDERVSIDIRAAAAALRENYGVNSISIFGTCYGGGRALEATARVYPHNTMDDVNGEEGPPHVDPMTTIAWYPTRYDAKALFGQEAKSINNNERQNTAIMAIFAGKDELPGATKDDAVLLKSCLDQDPFVKDQMVKVFDGQNHGFAHVGMGKITEEGTEEDPFLTEEFGGLPSNSMDDGDAEVASLLSTAFLETYSRQFLPTVGEAVQEDDLWNNIEMPDLSESSKRDIRAEMEAAIANYEEPEVDLKRMHPDDFKTPIDDLENMDDEFMEALQTNPYGVSIEDDPDAFLDKLEAAIERGDLSTIPGLGDIPLDDSVDGPAYW